VTDGDAIHAKILAEPDEDVHRLAYADWLDEQGDPARAEFIRVGCELARTPETVEVVEDWPVEVVDGDAVRVAGAGFGAGFGADAAVTYALRGDTLTTTRRAVNPEYKRLCDRRNELLEAFRPEWILPTPFTTQAEWDALDALSPPGVCTFRRGFVERVTCAGDDWARHGDAVLAAHPVRRVMLTTWPAFADNRYRQRGIPAVVRQNLRTLWPRVEFVLPAPAPDIPDHPDYVDPEGDGTGGPGEHLTYP